jgi:hypothetical protein
VEGEAERERERERERDWCQGILYSISQKKHNRFLLLIRSSVDSALFVFSVIMAALNQGIT